MDRKYRILIEDATGKFSVYYKRFTTAGHAEDFIFDVLCDSGVYADCTFHVVSIQSDAIHSRKTTVVS